VDDNVLRGKIGNGMSSVSNEDIKKAGLPMMLTMASTVVMDYLKYALIALALIACLIVLVGLTAKKPPNPADKKNLYAGNLHMHTTCSDGKDSYDVMVEESLKRGFKFIAITDHKVCPDYMERCRNETRLLCIPSMEFTTPNGHILAIDITKDPAEAECGNNNDTYGENNEPPCTGGLSLSESIRRIHEQGGIAIAAHPMTILPNNWLKKISGEDLRMFDAMECDATGYSPAERMESEELVRKLGIPCVFDSDAHDIESLGMMYNICELNQNLSKEAVKDAIVKNKCRSSQAGYLRI